VVWLEVVVGHLVGLTQLAGLAEGRGSTYKVIE
jgi:hypothetical protein